MEEQAAVAQTVDDSELPQIEEDPSNATLGQDEPTFKPPKKRKRDPEDTGEKGQAPGGHEAPLLPKSEGGPSELKRIRETVPKDRDDVLEIMSDFKDIVTKHARKILDSLGSDQPQRVEMVTKSIEQQSKLTAQDWVDQLSNTTVYIFHTAGLHSKLVDSVLLHLGITMQDLSPILEDAIKIYDELCVTTKHLCTIIHANY